MGWGIACGVLLLLSLLPLGIRIRYDSSGFTLRVIAGPVKFTVFPRKRREKTPEKKKETGEKHQESKLSAAKEEPKQLPKQESDNPAAETGGRLERLLPFVRLGLKFLGDLRRKLRLNNLYLRIILACDDPCDLAVNYGRVWAGIANLIPALERLFVIKKRDIQVECDFTSDQTRIVAHVDITITLGRLLVLAVNYGIRVLIEYFAMKRKGGAVK